MKKGWMLSPLFFIFLGCAITGNDGKIVNSKNSAKEIVYEKDSSTMVLIPAGEFIMGTSAEDKDEQFKHPWSAAIDEQYPLEFPQHVVYLDAFYIDKYEVTNAMFEKFVKATGYVTTAEKQGWSWASPPGKVGWDKVRGADWRHPRGPNTTIKGFAPILSKENHPVVNVSWYDALAYCEWAGKRLPTEAEWEKTARCTDARWYPWGNTWDISLCNSWDIVDKLAIDTKPVGSYPAGVSPYGVHDCAGNVSEWCSDWFLADYYSQSPQKNPLGPQNGEQKVLRGGSYKNTPSIQRCATRIADPPSLTSDVIGFRCVISAAKAKQ